MNVGEEVCFASVFGSGEGVLSKWNQGKAIKIS